MSFMVGIVGAAEQVWQTWQPPDQCFDLDSIADPFLVGKKPVYCQHASTESCRKLTPKVHEMNYYTFSASF